MMEQVDDPLKTFDQILEADERSGFFATYDPATGIRKRTLEDHHREIAQITLHENVPVGVRQLFETAKNIVLYSWFVYRFHQPAELCACGAVEMALAAKAEIDAQDWWVKASGKRPPGLGRLLEEAKRREWIKNEGFSIWRHRQQTTAWQLAKYKQISEIKKLGNKGAPALGFEDFEGAIGAPDCDYISILIETLPSVRNNLAHGSRTLHPNSISTLELCAELINQLF